MKFKFCGNNDCPEWLITEITILNKINAVKIRILTSRIITVILSNSSLSSVSKMLEEMNFSNEEINIIISVIHFIITSSVINDVDSIVLNQELQQLGVPQENSDSISKVYKSNSKELTNLFTVDTFYNDRLSFKSDGCNDLKWKINTILSDNFSSFNRLKNKIIDQNEDIDLSNHKLNKHIELKIKNDVYSVNKEVLGKLIMDLEKASNIIKKNVES